MASGQQFLFAPEKPLVKRLGKKFFRKIPKSAGVYKMRDGQDRIVYVGKAKNLRQRLRSYRVANPENMVRRHLRMVHEVARIEFVCCPSEAAALKQEAKLIRELKPKYNRAGVWQGKAQFLTWRFSEASVEFAVHEVPPVCWERYGSIGSYAPMLRASLGRLLWLALNPHKGFNHLPNGWSQNKFGDDLIINCGERREEIRVLLTNLFWHRAEEFLLWIAASIKSDRAGFERAAILADINLIQEFISKQRERTGNDGQIALL